MTEYRVTWTVDVDAESPEDAAVQAHNMAADPATTATVYDVQPFAGGKPTGKSQAIDLAKV